MGNNMNLVKLNLSLIALLVLAQLPLIVDSRLSGPSYGIEILSVETGVHVNGEWYSRSSFGHLEPVEAAVTLKILNSSITQVCLAFTVMDSEQRPVLFQSCLCAIEEGEIQEVSVYLGTIPSYACLGNAALYSNVLTDLPNQGGKPLCPQYRHDFGIWWNAADINCDYVVSFFDVVVVCASYGSTASDPLWNERCDIATPYRSIDIFDVMKVMTHYSEAWS